MLKLLVLAHSRAVISMTFGLKRMEMSPFGGFIIEVAITGLTIRLTKDLMPVRKLNLLRKML